MDVKFGLSLYGKTEFEGEMMSLWWWRFKCWSSGFITPTLLSI